MYIVDIENGTVKPAHAMKHEDHCPILEASYRLCEELKDWKKYKKMAGEQADSPECLKYAPVASQEFQHALLAASDLFLLLRQHGSDLEKEQLLRLMTSITAG